MELRRTSIRSGTQKATQSFTILPGRGCSSRSFLDLLRKLDIRVEEIHFRSFDSNVRSRWTVPWRKAFGISARFTFGRCRAPFGLAGSSESWLAIESDLEFDTEVANGSGHFGLRFLMVMAYVSFGVDQG